MWPSNELTELLGVRWPILQAPMAGGPGSPELAAAVSEAGGLGSLGLGYLSAQAGRAAIGAVRARTDQPFAANLFVPSGAGDGEGEGAVAAARSRDLIRPFLRELGLGDDAATSSPGEPFEAQVAVLVEERVPLVSFTFGAPPPDVVGALHEVGTLVMGTATTVAEALVLETAGCDIVCAQGGEAGGHHGAFVHDPRIDAVGTVALVPAVADTVGLPVVAAGGVMDGRGIVAALALGARAVQMGTAFLRCPEAGTNPAYRAALAAAAESDTVRTSAFSGRTARGVLNRYVEVLGRHPDVARYPVMNALTRELRAAAVAAGSADLQSLWAGQGVALGRDLPAAQLVRVLVEEVAEVLDRLHASGT
ncbi:MAG: nitronate monooxygenase [Actinomycetota bacterium]|jgi:nitronate monooxygenase|nr:nitronate monooxygenase [Actinomycetota bacterium]